MSTTPTNSDINFMDEEKRDLCKKVQEIISKDDGEKFGARARLMVSMTILGVNFIEELTKEHLKDYLKYEDYATNGILEEKLVEGLSNSPDKLGFNQ
jgi:hypothetical protein